MGMVIKETIITIRRQQIHKLKEMLDMNLAREEVISSALTLKWEEMTSKTFLVPYLILCLFHSLE